MWLEPDSIRSPLAWCSATTAPLAIKDRRAGGSGESVRQVLNPLVVGIGHHAVVEGNQLRHAAWVLDNVDVVPGLHHHVSRLERPPLSVRVSEGVSPAPPSNRLHR